MRVLSSATKPLDSVREIIYHANENYEWIFPTNVSLFATQPFFDDCVAFFVAKARKAIGGSDE